MTSDFYKEQIKLETEWLRMYFILLIADLSGSATLVLRLTEELYSYTNWLLLLIGSGIAIVLLLLMLRKNKKIKQFFPHLNTTRT